MVKNTKKLFGRDFTLVVVGQIISLFGNAVLRFALPLYLLRETGSSTLFGMVTACSFLPMVLLSLAGGVLADRVDKKAIMVLLDFGTAASITLFYLSLGRVPLVPLITVFLMLLYGISGAYQPAVQASIPALVPKEGLLRGNAAINMVSTLSSLLGPVVGGILFGAWGIGPILVLSIACFTCSAVMELFLCIPHRRRAGGQGLLATIGGDLKESWLFVREQRPALLPAVWTLALFNLALSACMIVGIPILVVNVLGMADAALGVTQGALGLGGLAGGCLAGAIAHRLRLRHCSLLLFTCAAAVAVMGLSLLLPAGAGYVVITAMGFAAMAAATLFTVQMCTMVQQQTPPHLVGKIMAAILAIANCAQPVGQALYGLLFDVLSTAPWLVVLGAAAAALLISLFSKGIFANLEGAGPAPGALPETAR